ncbi:hypothetical protein Spith_2124 [Spirochaeta thermophila DSM 6578]|uniref:SHSP domain-containing protein n=1 Tax=Winmispira thermophila (strain ATCC 700085 / DSM 6578 / Z-1203) TaxID=869211 RepID=G0GF35_WINT7|nr:Hsp20/alpha crystallin family protein [Spirochaeta thermophila]AEJ62379.1 hypothetical protein Spith_2124 [Spirochaeta thermophila DSM 6578]
MAKIEIDFDKVAEDIKKATKVFMEVLEENLKTGAEEVQRTFSHLHGEEAADRPDLRFPRVEGLLSNIYLTEENTLVLEFLVPGCGQEDIDLEFKGEYLVLSVGKREDDPRKERAYFYRKGFSLGQPVEARYYIPSDVFDHDRVKAFYHQGILRVEVPMVAQKVKQKKIKIATPAEDRA